jgi:hypothetical protein
MVDLLSGTNFKYGYGHDYTLKQRNTGSQWVCLEYTQDKNYLGSILYSINTSEKILFFYNISRSCTHPASGVPEAIFAELQNIAREAGATALFCKHEPIGQMGRKLISLGFNLDAKGNYVLIL